jgi:hypothetical protein
MAGTERAHLRGTFVGLFEKGTHQTIHDNSIKGSGMMDFAMLNLNALAPPVPVKRR